jgi:RNA polymerase sigma factor (sigma-70 family)
VRLPYQQGIKAMDELTLSMNPQLTGEQNRQIQEAVRKERQRLLDFIRRRVPAREDAEDILQEVFFELVEMYRLMKPVEQMASWLFTVARNKITDSYRKRKPSLFSDQVMGGTDDDDRLFLADLLPNNTLSPSDEMMREVILETVGEALEELPPEQREVFVGHELEGKSFKEMSVQLGVPLNTLLSRKRYAVLFLRERLRDLYNDLMD